MYKTLSVLFLTIFLSSFSKAEVVKKIEISGNKRVGTETIKIYGNIKRGEDYQKKDLNNILKNLYGTNFFSNVNVKLTNNVLRIELEEYPLINQLIVVGEPKTKYVEEIKKFISLKQNDSFITSKLQQDVGKIKEIYKSLGYNSVQVETKVRAIDKDNLDLVFEIEKGNQTKIKKITFTGDKKIKEKRLRDVIASEEDKFWKIISKNSKFNQNLVGLDQRLLKNYYKSLGYYDVEILSSSAEIKESGHVELTYSIEAGKRYLINKITTNADVIDKKIFYPLSEKYKKYIGSYYSPFKVQKILEEIDEIIDNNNLQFVEHNVEETIANDTISVQFNIFQGERILVERINILGNTITNEAVIRAELEIDEGDPYTDLGLDKSVANLKSRNIFKNVKTTVQAGSSKDLKVVDITVEEKPTGEISAGAGFGTNGGSFAFTVKENNWLGEGKQVTFEIDASADALKGTLNYSDPNYDFLGNAINYYLSSTSNDKPDQGYENTLMSVGAGTSFEQYKDVFVKLGLSASYDDLRTTGTASDSLKKQSGEFSEIAGNYGFTLDRRNRSFMPTDGEILSFSQMVPFYADRTYLDSAFSSSLYRSLSENVINSTKFFATAITGLNDDDVRISKRKYLSVRKLRGFRKGKVGPKDGLDHIGGNYAASLNFEASLPNILPESTNTDVGFFLDFGNVWGVDYDSTIDDKNKIRSSTGGVINWISPLGPMSFVFSQNISKASTDETESFNFQLGTTF
jgi:outer membrane protein insertion porin family